MLNTEEIIALTKVIKDKEKELSREHLEPGDYLIDFACHLQGTIKVGNDYDQHVVAKADPWLLLSVALSHLNGITVDSIVREALDSKLDADQVKDSCSKAIQAIKEPTLSTCKGKVTASLIVNKITK